MGQETGEKRAKCRPKGAANSIRYRLLGLVRHLDDELAVVRPVKEAVDDGAIASTRYDSYLDMLAEIELREKDQYS